MIFFIFLKSYSHSYLFEIFIIIYKFINNINIWFDYDLWIYL